MTLNPFRSMRIRSAWEYREEPESLRVLTGFFWHTSLLVVFLVLVFAIWFGFQELNATAAAESIKAASAPAAPPINRAQLQATLDVLSGKQATYQALASSSAAVIADPSK